MRAVWRAGITAEAFRWMLRPASKAPTAPAWNGCCAIARGRPLERLEQMADDALIYRFDKPQPDRRTQLRHTPWN
jgi:hypothetical protein